MTTMDILRPYEAQMIADRRWLHEHPELSGQETQTIDYIVKALEEMGLSIHIIPDGGVIAYIRGNKSGKTVMLRADIDALPIQEPTHNLSKERVCVSENDGVMHACGHDAHTAVLLTAGEVLNANKEELNGDVLLVFERGEEGGTNIWKI